MKILVNDECVCELNDTRKKVLCNDLNADEFDADMKRRVAYIVEHKYEQCFKRLKEEWEPKLKEAGVLSIPLDEDAFAELVFARPEYKDRKGREEEEKAKEAAQV